MKVFGKRSAEKQSLQAHKSIIERSGEPFFIAKANDEMCVNRHSIWCPGDSEATNYLNRHNEEHETLLLYPKAVLRLTRNLEKSPQGDLFILDYTNSNDSRLSLFKAP